jgi:hypothetical protein
MTQLDIASQARLETAPTRYVEGHGIRFAYRRLGPATGTPLVLLQHFSGNIDAWDPAVVNALSADRPMIAFDNAGVGRSTGQTPDNVEAMARDAVAFINLLGLSEVDLLGFPSAAASLSRSPPGTDGWSASSSSSVPRPKAERNTF